MNLEFTPNGWQDFEYWLEADEEISDKIRELLKDIKRNPFKGLGKPDPLKYNLKGFWSKRIADEHRLVYKITGSGDDQKCSVVQCRFHY